MTTQVWYKFWGASLVKAPAKNGIGRYVQQLQRITFSFCKSHGSSIGMREFVQKDLINFARNNPGVAVYVNPRRHHSPKIVAEYLNGDKLKVEAHNLKSEEIHKHTDHLRGCSGEVVYLQGTQYTDTPSIQGPWTPWIHRNPEVFAKTFPNDELSLKKKENLTGSDIVKDMFERQQQEQTNN